MCANMTKPFSREEKTGCHWIGNSTDLNPNAWAWKKFKPRETTCTNMWEGKRETVTPWVTRMSGL
jgi:hypothetical protein